MTENNDSVLFKEKQLKACKVCGIVKERTKEGVFGDGESPRWLDPKGDQWNGKMCPSCNRDRVRKYMKTKRSNKG